MDDVVLALTRLVLLGLLYLFLWRVARVVARDLRAPALSGAGSQQRAGPGPRPEVDRRTPRQLIVHQPSGSVSTVDLGTTPVRLGRSPELTVVVTDDYVSDEHTEFTPSADGWTVRDLGSTNGTHLNGAQVGTATPVAAGDQVRMGRTRVEVRR